ncbi:cortical protein KAR9-domain-containing protein [Bipolaris maydis]|nr:cortical protein KAR9-domain-containing protein [Bipolaris maydis]
MCNVLLAHVVGGAHLCTMWVQVSSPATAVDLPAKTPPNPSAAPSPAASSPKPLRPTPPHLESTTKLARNVSPGLLARMKFLNQPADAHSATKPTVDVGRIEQDRLRRLDEFRKARNLDIERRGTAWTARPGQSTPTLTPLIPQSTGGSVPALTMEPDFESDRSSVVSTSDKVLPSESDADGELDMQKYRLPDVTKPEKHSARRCATTTPPAATPATATATTTAAVQETPIIAPPQQSPQPSTVAALLPPLPIQAERTLPPTPPPKDSPPLHDSPPLPPLPLADPDEASVLDDNNGIDIESYFQRRHYPRAGSIYTLSKASFTNQIQQLTSMKLPPTTIASEITALASPTQAARALHKAANDIRLWVSKIKEVLSGLDADDDVEWAAAAGREGLAEVDTAISSNLQSRSDIALLPTRDQVTLVSQMEDIVMSWGDIKQTLKGIKNQVEIAMEWEELWNNVLGEIGAEVENLSRLVFEMEERRHRVISDSVAEAPEKFDIKELENIVEDLPRKQAILNSKRFSMPTLSILSPVSPLPQIEQENSRLLALFAKLQPLRASLDFLPMRLSTFQIRAKTIFPSLAQEKKLEAEADALREELGEDNKAVAILQQAIDDTDDEKLASRIATYKDKRDHYPPSMRRVLELIDIEMKHRATVNGEILRIQQDVRSKVEDLETVTGNMDAILDDFTARRKLRDSVSTVLSARTETSFAHSNMGTPGSSPASSVVMSRKSSATSSAVLPRARSPDSLAPHHPSQSCPQTDDTRACRRAQLPLLASPCPRLVWTLRLLAPTAGTLASQARVKTPTDKAAPKPRWNSDTHLRDTIIGHNFKPLSLSTPSPFRKDKDTPSASARSSSSRRSSNLSPAMSASPMETPATPGEGRPVPRSTPTSPPQAQTTTPGSSRRATTAKQDGMSPGGEESPAARRASRPSSSATNHRSGMFGSRQRPSSAPKPTETSPASTSGRTISRPRQCEWRKGQ